MTVRNKLAKLQEYDLIEYEGPAQNRVYRVRDEAIEPPVARSSGLTNTWPSDCPSVG